MTKLLSLVGATILSATQCNAFVAPGPTRASDVRLNAKLEGREIEGVLKPTTNFLLIKVVDIEDQTEGGILLTGTVSCCVIMIGIVCSATFMIMGYN